MSINTPRSMRIAYWDWFDRKDNVYTTPIIIDPDQSKESLIYHQNKLLNSQYFHPNYEEHTFELSCLAENIDVITGINVQHPELEETILKFKYRKGEIDLVSQRGNKFQTDIQIPICAIRENVFDLYIKNSRNIVFPNIMVEGYQYVNDCDYYNASVSSYTLSYKVQPDHEYLYEFQYNKKTFNIHIHKGKICGI